MRPLIQSNVLCVDLDGTLVRTDTLYECLLVAIKKRPDVLVRVPLWLIGGRYHLKRKVTHWTADTTHLEHLPVQPEVEDLVRTSRKAGKKVELVTAADQDLIGDSPRFRGLFDAIVGSADGTNLASEAKAALLKQRHPDGFAYVGNSAADLPVWRAASERFGVNVPASVRERARQEGLDLVELAPPHGVLGAFFRALRPHQWLKNLLVFVPLALLASIAEVADVFRFVVGFILMCLLTSGTYLINDLLDLEADRLHPSKRDRPIASGDLPIPIAGIASVALIAAALAGAFVLSPGFFAVLVAYLVLTVAYSLRLKQIALVDIMTIATLFTARILAGMVLVGEPPSQWLLTFSIFFFLSLSLMKREVELNTMAESGRSALKGRGYGLDDRVFVVSFGISTGVAALVVFALFVSAEVSQGTEHYAAPALLWGVMAVLGYWLAHMWLLTSRGLMNDDPILYAARDRVSVGLGALAVVLALLAQVLPL